MARIQNYSLIEERFVTADDLLLISDGDSGATRNISLGELAVFVGAGGTLSSGPSILSGTTAPADSLGRDEDFYLQNTGGDLFLWGPKASGLWPAAGIQINGGGGGSTGDLGLLESTDANGVISIQFTSSGVAFGPSVVIPSGIDGTNGTNGTDGMDGADGAQGPIGPMGPAGMDGSGTNISVRTTDVDGAEVIRAINVEGTDYNLGDIPTAPTTSGNYVLDVSSDTPRVYTWIEENITDTSVNGLDGNILLDSNDHISIANNTSTNEITISTDIPPYPVANNDTDDLYELRVVVDSVGVASYSWVNEHPNITVLDAGFDTVMARDVRDGNIVYIDTADLVFNGVETPIGLYLKVSDTEYTKLNEGSTGIRYVDDVDATDFMYEGELIFQRLTTPTRSIGFYRRSGPVTGFPTGRWDVVLAGGDFHEISVDGTLLPAEANLDSVEFRGSDGDLTVEFNHTAGDITAEIPVEGVPTEGQTVGYNSTNDRLEWQDDTDTQVLYDNAGTDVVVNRIRVDTTRTTPRFDPDATNPLIGELILPGGGTASPSAGPTGVLSLAAGSPAFPDVFDTESYDTTYNFVINNVPSGDVITMVTFEDPTPDTDLILLAIPVAADPASQAVTDYSYTVSSIAPQQDVRVEVEYDESGGLVDQLFESNEEEVRVRKTNPNGRVVYNLNTVDANLSRFTGSIAVIEVGQTANLGISISINNNRWVASNQTTTVGGVTTAGVGRILTIVSTDDSEVAITSSADFTPSITGATNVAVYTPPTGTVRFIRSFRTGAIDSATDLLDASISDADVLAQLDDHSQWTFSFQQTELSQLTDTYRQAGITTQSYIYFVTQESVDLGELASRVQQFGSPIDLGTARVVGGYRINRLRNITIPGAPGANFTIRTT